MDDLVEEYYEKHYDKIHYRGNLGRFTSFYHSRLEHQLTKEDNFEKVLEIGGGSGQHLDYVTHGFESYLLTDISEMSGEKLAELNQKFENRISFKIANAEKLSFGDQSFDRIIASCVLLHLADPDRALREIQRVVKPGGIVDLYLPCDPGIFYRLIRHWFSHRKQHRAMEIPMSEIKYLWASEHPNHIWGIRCMILKIFAGSKVKVTRFPFRIFGPSMNLFFTYRIFI